ncbi:MAG: 16S rRNA (uracil(1498)-N(3))-methyltransferase [Thiogranum sp.]|nr:16S rRNA (uracil(1498)-N(3))-methyltransferase [Thiogranum sp.]
MRIPRIYISQPLAPSGSIELEERGRHYLSQVLRLHSGDKIIGFNGNGNEYHASIAELGSKKVVIEIESECHPERESELQIELGQGISRGERMDLVFQKAIELGVHSLAPIWTRRCQVQLSGARLEKRLLHWRGIIQSACEQSGRTIVPPLQSAASLDTWLTDSDDALAIVLDPGASLSLGELSRASRVRLLVGPEGGLEADEVQRAQAKGFIPVRLGPRILRTETAAIAALTALQTLWGDLAI